MGEYPPIATIWAYTALGRGLVDLVSFMSFLGLVSFVNFLNLVQCFNSEEAENESYTPIKKTAAW